MHQIIARTIDKVRDMNSKTHVFELTVHLGGNTQSVGIIKRFKGRPIGTASGVNQGRRGGVNVQSND